MAATEETGGRTTGARPRASAANASTTGNRPGRARRYVPLVAWACLVLFASTGTLSASNTSRIIEPLVRWLFPRSSEAGVESIHFFIRKCAHFTEYAILALLAARAFLPSSKDFLRRHWLTAALALVVCVSLADEYNQSFNPARTGTIKDSALDTFGGATALVALARARSRRAKRVASL